MISANIYLTFNGTCEEVFNYYREVFGGDFSTLARFSEMPLEEGELELPSFERDRIMHIGLPLTEGTILMGCDVLKSRDQAVELGNNFSIALSLETKDEALRIFKQLSTGGKILIPLSKAFWGGSFGMLKDKFGIQWMVSCEE